MGVTEFNTGISAYINERTDSLSRLNYMREYLYFFNIITNNNLENLREQFTYKTKEKFIYSSFFSRYVNLIFTFTTLNYALIYDFVFDETLIYIQRNPRVSTRDKYIYFVKKFNEETHTKHSNTNYTSKINFVRECKITPHSKSEDTYQVYEKKGKEPLKDFFNAISGGMIEKLNERKFIFYYDYLNELINEEKDSQFNLDYCYEIEDLVYDFEIKSIVNQVERKVEDICEDSKDKDKTFFLQECCEIIRLIYPEKGINKLLDETPIGAYIDNSREEEDMVADIYFKTVFLGLIYNESMDKTDSHFKNINADIKEKYKFFAKEIKNRAKHYSELADPKYVIYSKVKRILKETNIKLPVTNYKLVPVDNNIKNNEDIFNCLTGGLYGILQKRPCTYLSNYKNLILERKIIKDVKIRELLLYEDKKLVFNPKR